MKKKGRMDGCCNHSTPKHKPPTPDYERVGKGGLPTGPISGVTSGGKIRQGKVSGEKGPR